MVTFARFVFRYKCVNQLLNVLSSPVTRKILGYSMFWGRESKCRLVFATTLRAPTFSGNGSNLTNKYQNIDIIWIDGSYF